MRYKVGDKVRVRGDLIVGKRYGQYFNKDMVKFKNKEVTIKRVLGNFYHIEEEAYCWTDEMFEPVVVTNWDKVKEVVEINDNFNKIICNAIHKVKDERNCGDRACIECREWLKQPYKESILDEAEKKYLSAVIRPFRDKVVFINKKESGRHPDKEFIKIKVKDDSAFLPVFDEGTMYKGMELNKQYSLDDLEI